MSRMAYTPPGPPTSFVAALMCALLPIAGLLSSCDRVQPTPPKLENSIDVNQIPLREVLEGLATAVRHSSRPASVQPNTDYLEKLQANQAWILASLGIPTSAFAPCFLPDENGSSEASKRVEKAIRFLRNSMTEEEVSRVSDLQHLLLDEQGHKRIKDELSIIKEQCTRLQERASVLDKDISRARDTEAGLRQQLNELGKQGESARKIVSERNDEIGRLKSDLRASQNEVARLEKAIRDLKGNSNGLEVSETFVPQLVRKPGIGGPVFSYEGIRYELQFTEKSGTGVSLKSYTVKLWRTNTNQLSDAAIDDVLRQEPYRQFRFSLEKPLRVEGRASLHYSLELPMDVLTAANSTHPRCLLLTFDATDDQQRDFQTSLRRPTPLDAPE